VNKEEGDFGLRLQYFIDSFAKSVGKIVGNTKQFIASKSETQARSGFQKRRILGI
jgi:hypothetical protein